MWECMICGRMNKNKEEICIECGALKEEACYDIMDDLEEGR